MKILLLNGSPRRATANSLIYLEAIRARLGEAHEYRMAEAMAGGPEPGDIDVDSIILAFPLYNNCMHSSLLSWLISCSAALAEARASGGPPRRMGMIAVANSGCPDGGIQNGTALKIVADFCARSGIEWRGGLGIGCGEMTKILAPLPGWMPLKRTVSRALDEIASRVADRDSRGVPAEPLFAAYLMPWPLFRIAAHAEWRRRAKANGLDRDSLLALPIAAPGTRSSGTDAPLARWPRRPPRFEA